MLFIAVIDNKCQINISGILTCMHLERGNVVGGRFGDSSGSVGSEEYSDGPSSTTSVGIAPLPCSIDTTFSWEQFLQRDMGQESILREHFKDEMCVQYYCYYYFALVMLL